MGKSRFSADFKRGAVHQITIRGYVVRDVSERLGVSTHSLYKWLKMYNPRASAAARADQDAEIRRLKKELERVTEERDILNTAS